MNSNTHNSQQTIWILVTYKTAANNRKLQLMHNNKVQAIILQVKYFKLHGLFLITLLQNKLFQQKLHF
jgi:hypothetical protein